MVVGAIAVAVVHRMALYDLRSVERSYVEGRQVTACATASLAPFADQRREMDELPGAVEAAVLDARDRLVAVRAALPDNGSGLFGVRGAREAVASALTAELALYEVMAADPATSDDELLALGQANAEAERKLAAARRALRVSAGRGWSARFRCA